MITFIRDYHNRISVVLSELEESDAKLAHQLRKQAQLRKQHDTIHLQRFRQLSLLDGFTGSLCLGRRTGDGEDGDGAIDGTLEAIDGPRGDTGASGDNDDDDGDDGDINLAMRIDTTMNIVLADV